MFNLICCAVAFPECLCNFTVVQRTFIPSAPECRRDSFWWMFGSFGLDMPALQEMGQKRGGRKKKAPTSGSVFSNGVKTTGDPKQPPTRLKWIESHSDIHQRRYCRLKYKKTRGMWVCVRPTRDLPVFSSSVFRMWHVKTNDAICEKPHGLVSLFFVLGLCLGVLGFWEKGGSNVNVFSVSQDEHSLPDTLTQEISKLPWLSPVLPPPPIPPSSLSSPLFQSHSPSSHLLGGLPAKCSMVICQTHGVSAHFSVY